MTSPFSFLCKEGKNFASLLTWQHFLIFVTFKFTGVLLKKLILIIASGFGTGYSPWIPGTVGSLVGLLLFWPLHRLAFWPYLATLVGLIFLSTWISTIAETLFGEKDSRRIVIDEIVGMLVTLSFLPFTWKWALAGFLLFRLFDIWKPFPARLCQERLPGGWGVVWDDVVAGIYANLLLQVIGRLVS